MANTELSNIAEGTAVTINENGVPVEFLVAKHNYESTLNGKGRTLLVRKNACDERQWHTSNINAYANSAINTWLNGTYKARFDSSIQSAMSTTQFYYTPGNGNNTVTTLSRAIFLPSATEFNNIQVPDVHNREGSPILPSELRTNSSSQFTRSPYIGDKSQVVYSLSKLMAWGYANSTNTNVYRPAFTLPATQIFYTPPTIKANYSSGTNLGEIDSTFDFTYIAQNAGSAATAKEYLDGVLIRSYTTTSNVTNTFESVTSANWAKILNGAHTLKIIINDGTKNSEEHVVYFTKKVTEATVTLSEPLADSGDIEIMIMSIAGSLPEDVNLEILVTNNAKDATPIWEDATKDIRRGSNYLFSNKTATNGFAFNFKLTVSRGSSDTGGHISVIGGAFQ